MSRIHLSPALSSGLSVVLVAFGLLSGMPPARAETFVYVGTTGANQIHAYKFDGFEGTLAEIETTQIPTLAEGADTSTPMTVSRDKKHLYTMSRGVSTVSSYSINAATGRLTHVGDTAFPGGVEEGWAFIATDRSGRYLLGSATDGHKIAVSRVREDGLIEPAHQVLETAPKAHAIITDQTNRYAFVTSLNGDLVHQYRFDAEKGLLSPNDPALIRVKEGAGPRHLVFHPNGKLVYVLNELDASVDVFDYHGESGLLTRKQVVATLPADFAEPSGRASDLHITPDGKFLYMSERHTSTIVGFEVDQNTGEISQIGRFASEKQPRGFGIDPSGRFLLAVGQLSDSMTVYSIDPASGNLETLRRYPMGKNPNWIEFVSLP